MDEKIDGKTTGLALALIAALLLLHLPFRSQYFYERDSVQLALGAYDFDILKNQPQAPGYPLWVLLERAARALTPDLNLAQIVFAQVFTALGAFFFVLLALRNRSRNAALFSCALLLLAPPVQLYSVVATIHPVDLFTSALMGWCAARLWEGEERLAPFAAALWSLCAGFSLNGALAAAPLLCVSLARCGAYRWRFWLKTLAAGAAIFLAWFVPAMRSQSESVAWFGSIRAASPGTQWQAALWLGEALAAPLLAALLCRLSARGASPQARVSPAWDRPLFYLLWCGPGLLFAFLTGASKPGCLLGALVPLVFWLSGAGASALERVAARSERKAEYVAQGAVFIGLCLSLVLALYPFQRHFETPHGALWRALACSSLRDVELSDQAVEKVASLAHSGRGGAENLVFVLYPSNSGPNWRKLMYYLPDVPVCTFGNRQIACAERGDVAESDVLIVPPNIRRIWWVAGSEVLPQSILKAFPTTEPAVTAQTFSVWQTNIGPAGLEAKFEWEGKEYFIACPNSVPVK